MSSWFLKDCHSQSKAESICKEKSVGGFVIWPSPKVKSCLIYSHKRSDQSIAHLKIFKEKAGFRTQNGTKHYATLELLILGIRKSLRPTPATKRKNAPKPVPESKEQEEIISEVKEMFPTAARDKIVRATTLAGGDKSKVIELLLTQKMDSAEKKKQQHLCKVIVTVIGETKKRLVGYNKYINNAKKLSDITSLTASKLTQNLVQIKKLLRKYPGAKINRRPIPTGSSALAKMQAFKRSNIDNLKEIFSKFTTISKQVKTGKLSLKKLLIIGGSMKAVKQTVDDISIDFQGNPTNGVQLNQRAQNSPNNAKSQNYIINYNELKLGDVIGEGAYGKVYKADYKGRVVAVKSLAELKDEKEKNWMKREINLLKQVKHPNVTEFIGISKTPEGHMLIVMEFVSGGELYEKLLDEDIDMGWPLKLRIAYDVASALAYMHKRKLIHRDIKSENLLVDENWNTKLCDFGFARAIENRQRARMTVCGSPYFNAPELLLGKAYNDKVDVFAYGILLCEIITRGKVNLDRLGKSSFNAFALDIESVSQDIPSDCPPVFWKVAACCCNYEPEKRPSMMQVEKMIGAVRSRYDKNFKK